MCAAAWRHPESPAAAAGEESLLVFSIWRRNIPEQALPRNF
jgi:hypothetical protein